jgi:adenine phosphoribosyltransferase
MVDEAALKDLIRDIPDFPEPGVIFKDITPLLGHADTFRSVVLHLADHYADAGITKVAGIEARGFIFAAPVAAQLGAGFVPIRKAGKLPHDVESEDYALEYGTDLLEIHKDAAGPGDVVLIVDDVVATGGTLAASITLIERLDAGVAGVAAVVELDFLGGRAKLPQGIDLLTLIHY